MNYIVLTLGTTTGKSILLDFLPEVEITTKLQIIPPKLAVPAHQKRPDTCSLSTEPKGLTELFVILKRTEEKTIF